MYDWEYRLTTRDTNRVPRPLDYGLEWTRNWPIQAPPIPGAGTGSSEPPERAAADLEGFRENGDVPADELALRALNERILRASDCFFSYSPRTDYQLDSDHGAQLLHFTSAVETPYACNNRVRARWFPAPGRRAMIVLPQWNADADSHNGLCRIFQWLGVASLRLSMPYHDVRKPAETERADYAVSSNLGRTIDAVRQAVVDVRCCLDWLEQRGYRRFGILGTSLGSCDAFIASAHDRRLEVNIFNHASTYFADPVWMGQSTRHIRTVIESAITLERLRPLWHAISPMCYFDQFARFDKKSLIVHATYDLTFPPELSRQLIAEFARRQLDHRSAVLPCGHYTTGETPFKYLDAWHIARFVNAAF
jgi:hypothetical protein